MENSVKDKCYKKLLIEKNGKNIIFDKCILAVKVILLLLILFGGSKINQ